MDEETLYGDDVELSEGVTLPDAVDADGEWDDLATLDSDEDDTLEETDGGEQVAPGEVIVENTANLDTTVSVKRDERVIITVIDGEPVVTGVVGGGDNMQGDIDSALESARTIEELLAGVQELAEEADKTVAEILEMGAEAGFAAEQAKESAKQAADIAKAAAYNLSRIEDVVDQANWIGEHGTYVNQSGASFNPDKVYYTRSGTAPNYVYAVVPEPKAADIASYYVLQLDESVYNYLQTHLYYLNQNNPAIDGLYVAGGAGQYRLRLTGSRLSFVDEKGVEVAYFAADEDGFSTLYVARTVVMRSISFGKWEWFQTDTNGMAVKWKG